MKRLIAVAVLGLLMLPSFLPAADWFNAVTTNPTAGQVVIDTGPITTDGYYRWCVTAASTVAATLRVQHRDTTNTVTLHEQYLPVVSGSEASLCIPSSDLAVLILTNERLRVVNTSLIAAGTVSTSIFISVP